MNRQIRGVAYILMILLGVIYLNDAWIQLVRAGKLANNPANIRQLLREYSIERGAILSSDNQTLALSQKTPKDQLKFLRTYPAGPLFSDVIGYYSLIFGRDGLERSYNKFLIGGGGVLSMQDLGDRLLGRGQKGDTLILSIDSRLQAAATKALGNHRGAVVAIDPLNGQVLALVSYPSFDPNQLSGHDQKAMRSEWDALRADKSNPLLDRATSEAYPPGSTFKVVTASAALERGKGTDTSFPPAATYQPPLTDKKIGNFGGISCGGNMADALKESCNVWFARLGAELPKGALGETAANFGFGSTPPIDIGASPSKMPSETELRSPAYAAQTAIGQFNVAATPLQMALVAAGIANGGRIPVPRIVKQVRDARGAVVSDFPAAVWKEAVSSQTAAQVRDLMVSVVDGGTGTAAAIPGIRVAGKTGTAQTGRPNESPHAWFICFAPADSPRIAVAVLVENGGDLGSEATGGRVAAPIARQVLDADRAASGW